MLSRPVQASMPRCSLLSLSPAFNPWRMCCSVFPFSPPLFSSVESFRAPPCSAPFLPEPLPPVSALCDARLDESVEAQHLLTPLLLFVQENVRESRRRHRVLGRRCRHCPCSVSSPLRRTPGQARVTTMPSHPRRPLVQIGDSENPLRRQIASRSAAATPSLVVASVFRHLELCLTTLDPFHQLQETANPCSHPRSCESCRR
jgi:hypothetical protein